MLRFRYSLRTLLIAVTLVAVGIATWQAYDNLLIPYKEAEAERLMIERQPPYDGDNGLPRYTFREELDFVAYRSGGWSKNEAPDIASLPAPGFNWYFAKQRPIKGLIFYRGDFTDIDPQQFATFSQLTHVRINAGQAQLTDEQVTRLISMPRLKSVLFDGVRLSDEQIDILSQNKSLRELSLQAAGLDDADINKLGPYPDLEYLNLTHNNVSDVSIPRIVQGSPRLKWLSLASCPGVQDDSAAAIGSLKELVKLHLNRTSVTDQGVERMAGCPKLTTLWIVDAPFVTDACLDSVSRMPALETIRIRTSGGITSANLQQLRQKRPALSVN